MKKARASQRLVAWFWKKTSVINICFGLCGATVLAAVVGVFWGVISPETTIIGALGSSQLWIAAFIAGLGIGLCLNWLIKQPQKERKKSSW